MNKGKLIENVSERVQIILKPLGVDTPRVWRLGSPGEERLSLDRKFDLSPSRICKEAYHHQAKKNGAKNLHFHFVPPFSKFQYSLVDLIGPEMFSPFSFLFLDGPILCHVSA